MHKVIHQYWEGEEMPGVLRRLCATWRDLNPGYAYRLWDAASVAAEFAGDHRYSEFAALCHGIAERSDMIRYFLLWRFGGWWADTDFECVVPLDSWDMPDPVDGLVGAADEAGNVRRTAISLLYAEPQCAILERAIAGLDESLRQATGTLARTGNHFLERFLPERMALIAASRVFPTGFGNWREKLALGRDALFGGGVWACHYWWGTWVGGLSSREPELIEAFLNGGTGGTGKGGIFVHGFGGIGNQLFQLAYGLHLEQRFGCPLAGNLGLLAGLDGVPEAATGGTPPDNLPLLRHCDEAEAERILGGNGGRSLGLMGIFQEYGHFESQRHRLGELFGPVVKREAIGVHVRRGDYLSAGHYMGLTPAYYRSGVLRLIHEAGVPCQGIVIFSDDPAWCRAEILPVLEGIAPVEIFEGSGAVSLRAMKAMRGMVIPNSTFGWWGAWLADCPVLHPGAWAIPGGFMAPALGCDHPGWKAHGLHWQECRDTPPTGENDLPTIVSAYFELEPFPKGDQGVRDPAWYRGLLRGLALLANPLVFFAESEDDMQTVLRLRAERGLPTMVAQADRTLMRAFERVERVRRSIASADFPLSPPNTTMAEYSCVQHAKYELVAEAIRLGWLRTTHCCWMDCGKLIECLELDSRCLYRINPATGDPRLVHYTEAAPFGGGSLREIQTARGGEGDYWLAGGFFCGETPVVDAWCHQYLAAALRYQEEGWVFTDQVVLTAMASAGGTSGIVGHRFSDPWFGLCRSLLERVAGPSRMEAAGPAQAGCPQPENPGAAAAGSVRLALMFLTRGDLNHPGIWEEFAGDGVDAFAHVKRPGDVRSGFLGSARKVEPVDTQWGSVSLVRATLRLLETSLRESDATHFALLSESCVPIKPLAEIVSRLGMDPRSRIAWEGLGDMAISHRHRVASAREVPADRWVMQHQWMVLNREAAEWVVSEDLTDRFENVFAPDEHYFATVLALMGYPFPERVRRARSTWVDWGIASPRSWLSVGPELALELRESQSFFARKFLPESDIGRWKLHVDSRPFIPFSPGGLGIGLSKPRGNCRILVAVCSKREDRGARQACRETWLSGIRGGGTLVRFFIGEGTHTGEEDAVGLMVSDAGAELPGKVLAMLTRALENHEFDWIFRCEDTSYVDLDRLASLVSAGADVVADGRIMDGGGGCGNTCYLLSRGIAGRLVRDGRIAAKGSDRELVVREALRLGAKVVLSDSLRSDGLSHPRADNAIVCGRAGDPARMRAVHSLRTTEPTVELRAEHPGWKDSLLVHADGTFARKAGYWAGTVARDPAGMLLKWFDWEPERLVEAPDGQWSDFRVENLDWTGPGGADGLDALAAMHAARVPVELVHYGPPHDGGWLVPAGLRFDRVITVGAGQRSEFETDYAGRHPATRFDRFDPTPPDSSPPLPGGDCQRTGAAAGYNPCFLLDLVAGRVRDGETVLLRMDCGGAEWTCGLERIDPGKVHVVLVRIHGMLGTRGRMAGGPVMGALAEHFALVHARADNRAPAGRVRGHQLTDGIELTLVSRRIVGSLRKEGAPPPPAFENDPEKPAARLELLVPESLRGGAPRRAVFSLSTSPSRIKTIGATVRSLLAQTRPPDRIHVNCPWVFKRTGGEFAGEDLDALAGLAPGIIRINRCEDMGPVSKLLPTLEVEPAGDTLIVILDDDNTYPPELLERALDECAAVQGAVLANRFWTIVPGFDVAEGWRGIAIRRNLIDAGDFAAFVRTAVEDHDCYRSDDVVISYYLRLRGVPLRLFSDPLGSEVLDSVNLDRDALHRQDGVYHDVRYRRAMAVLGQKFGSLPPAR
jgi:hypothetical protein